MPVVNHNARGEPRRPSRIMMLSLYYDPAMRTFDNKLYYWAALTKLGMSGQIVQHRCLVQRYNLTHTGRCTIAQSWC